jgi:AcrR family transcriptional regulator
MPTKSKKMAAPVRARDAAATRNDILAAAQVLFTRHGYHHCSSRQIAAMAGVDVALVNRYFGSKQKLFATVMEEAFSIEPFFAAGKAGFAKALARYVVTKKKDRTQFDPLMVLLRSVSNPEANAVLQRALDEKVMRPLAQWLGGADAPMRASLIVAWLCGLDLIRDVLRYKPLLQADSEALVQELADAIQSVMKK